jgi:hypothetical protein
MPRYYVSFSFQNSCGFNIASLDVTTTGPIADVTDLGPVYGQLARQGYTDNVKILAFSLYANPTAAPSRPHTPKPGTERPTHNQHRRAPRPGRSS